jgi:hypothetical protein
MQYLIRQEKNKSCKFSPFFIFFFLNKTTSNMEMASYAKARSNLCTFNDATTEKQSLDLLFLSSPKSTYKILSRELGGKNTTGF